RVPDRVGVEEAVEADHETGEPARSGCRARDVRAGGAAVAEIAVHGRGRVVHAPSAPIETNGHGMSSTAPASSASIRIQAALRRVRTQLTRNHSAGAATATTNHGRYIASETMRLARSLRRAPPMTQPTV